MKKKTVNPTVKFDKDGYSKGPNLRGKLVKDFLPPPAAFKALRAKDTSKKITLSIHPIYFNVLSREGITAASAG